MDYWIVFKRQNGKWSYISGIDEHGNPVHSENEKDAIKFNNFHVAMLFFNLGYTIEKQ